MGINANLFLCQYSPCYMSYSQQYLMTGRCFICNSLFHFSTLFTVSRFSVSCKNLAANCGHEFL